MQHLYKEQSTEPTSEANPDPYNISEVSNKNVKSFMFACSIVTI